MNLYGYTGNDPVNLTDPKGLAERGVKNIRIDPAQVELLRQKVSDLKERLTRGNLPAKERQNLQKQLREANQKLKKQEKAMGERKSRQSKDRKGRGRARSVLPLGPVGAYLYMDELLEAREDADYWRQAGEGIRSAIQQCESSDGCSDSVRASLGCEGNECSDEDILEILRRIAERIEEQECMRDQTCA